MKNKNKKKKEAEGRHLVMKFFIIVLVIALAICGTTYALMSFTENKEYTPNVTRHGIFIGYWEPTSDNFSTWGITMRELEEPFKGEEYSFTFEQQDDLDVLKTLEVGKEYSFGIHSFNGVVTGEQSIYQLITILNSSGNVIWNYYD